jgi:hypothetical protein
MASEHPWAKQHRRTHDPLELWLEVEREVFAERRAAEALEEKEQQERTKCEPDAPARI